MPSQQSFFTFLQHVKRSARHFWPCLSDDVASFTSQMIRRDFLLGSLGDGSSLPNVIGPALWAGIHTLGGQGGAQYHPCQGRGPMPYPRRRAAHCEFTRSLVAYRLPFPCFCLQNPANSLGSTCQ